MATTTRIFETASAQVTAVIQTDSDTLATLSGPASVTYDRGTRISVSYRNKGNNALSTIVAALTANPIVLTVLSKAGPLPIRVTLCTNAIAFIAAGSAPANSPFFFARSPVEQRLPALLGNNTSTTPSTVSASPLMQMDIFQAGGTQSTVGLAIYSEAGGTDTVLADGSVFTIHIDIPNDTQSPSAHAL